MVFSLNDIFDCFDGIHVMMIHGEDIMFVEKAANEKVKIITSNMHLCNASYGKNPDTFITLNSDKPFDGYVISHLAIPMDSFPIKFSDLDNHERIMEKLAHRSKETL